MSAADRSIVCMNVFDSPQASGVRESFETLLEAGSFRLERIVSTGQATPPGEWYDQEQDEWVVLLRGAARLRIAAEATDRALMPGDAILIPAHCRHRVEWTDPTTESIWLALHFDPR